MQGGGHALVVSNSLHLAAHSLPNILPCLQMKWLYYSHGLHACMPILRTYKTAGGAGRKNQAILRWHAELAESGMLAHEGANLLS